MLAVWELFQNELQTYPGFFAPVVQSTEIRMAHARRDILGARIVGYVSDNHPETPNLRGEAAYYLTQYALTPTVVDRRELHELTVANLINTSAERDTRRWPGLLVITNYGDGVFLLRNPAP